MRLSPMALLTLQTWKASSLHTQWRIKSNYETPPKISEFSLEIHRHMALKLKTLIFTTRLLLKLYSEKRSMTPIDGM